MKLTTGYKKPIASSGTDAQEQSSNNSYLLLAGGGHKALSELVSPADLTTELSNYVTIGSNQTITGVKTFSQAINADITGNAATATNVDWSGVTNRPTNVSAFINDAGYKTTDTTYSTATSDTLGLVKIGYAANGKNYPVQLSNGQMYVNVPWTDTDTNTWRPITNLYLGTSSDISLSQKGGKAIYDALVNGYATNAGNAGTLNGYTADDFVLKTTYDVYESVIVESLNDLDNRKIEISDLPTSLPANGGHADTATNVDWSGVTNKPSSFPANGGNADTINGYSSSDFVLNTNYGEFKSVIATALTDLDSRKIEMSDIPTSLPASDVYDWAKAETKPSYSWSEIDSRPTNVSEFENDAGYITDSDAKFGDYLSLSGGTVTGQLYLTGLEEGTADITDNTELLTSYASNNGFSDTNATGKVYRRDAIKVYNYIKGKLDSVYSDIGHTHNTKEILDFPSSLPANGGNADTIENMHASDFATSRHTHSDYVTALSTDDIYLTWTKNDSISNIIVPYAEQAGDAGTLGGYHESAFSKNGHTHTKSEITDFPIIGNGRLILKNGNNIINDDFTANKNSDTIIDLNSTFTNKKDFNLLGDKVDKIDTSIAELNTAIRVDNPFNDPEDDDEDTIESNDDVLGYKIGDMSLRFYDITTYVDLPVYFVNVAKICDISEVGNSISSLYNIRITIDLTGTTIASTVGISSDIFKQFYIRGANMKNNICGFDVRGNGTTNTATAIISGKYLLLNCQLKLHGDKSDIGSFIMEEAKNGNFKAYLCLRQTI